MNEDIILQEPNLSPEDEAYAQALQNETAMRNMAPEGVQL